MTAILAGIGTTGAAGAATGAAGAGAAGTDDWATAFSVIPEASSTARAKVRFMWIGNSFILPDVCPHSFGEARHCFLSNLWSLYGYQLGRNDRSGKRVRRGQRPQQELLGL